MLSKKCAQIGGSAFNPTNLRRESDCESCDPKNVLPVETCQLRPKSRKRKTRLPEEEKPGLRFTDLT